MVDATAEVERATSERDDGITKYFGNTHFTAPLHGILHGNGPTLRYIYGYFYDLGHRHRRHNHRKHCTAPWRERPPLHQLSNANPFIGISNFIGHSFSSWFDSIVVSIWLDSICGFDLTRLVFFFFFRFNSRSTYLFLTQVIQFKSYFNQASGSPTLTRVSLKYFQHWNRGIFHNSDNWIWVWQKNILMEKKLKIRGVRRKSK